MKSTNVALIGMPGVGKSTFGKTLSDKLGYSFVDTDTYLERLLGCSISDYFCKFGEAEFRSNEAAAIEKISASQRTVIATGGGAVTIEASRTLLKARCLVVYLYATPEVLLPRLLQDVSRPLLRVDDPLSKLREMYALRHPLYVKTAHLVFPSTEATPHAFFEAVARVLD